MNINKSLLRASLLLLLSLLPLSLLQAAPASQEPPRPGQKQPRRPTETALRPVQDVPGLPRVLLLGDSISIGYTLPVSAGSLTAGKPRVNGEVDLGKMVAIARLEFTSTNPGYRRGQGGSFELQTKQADGSWQTIHQGRVFGSNYSKTFEPVRAQVVRLKMEGPEVPQFVLFPINP